jgi:two-component sensor histidine kinase
MTVAEMKARGLRDSTTSELLAEVQRRIRELETAHAELVRVNIDLLERLRRAKVMEHPPSEASATAEELPKGRLTAVSV